MPPADVVYRIDAADRIVYANAAFDRFARANDGDAAMSRAILARPLWDFIVEPTTRQLYGEAIRRARCGSPVRFEFRCDSADRRRLLEMTVRRRHDGSVEFRVRALRDEDREPVALLDPAAPRDGGFLRACSWCKRFEVGEVWVEVEEAAARLHLLERAVLPAITHGICAPCMQTLEHSLGLA